MLPPCHCWSLASLVLVLLVAPLGTSVARAQDSDAKPPQATQEPEQEPAEKQPSQAAGEPAANPPNEEKPEAKESANDDQSPSKGKPEEKAESKSEQDEQKPTKKPATDTPGDETPTDEKQAEDKTQDEPSLTALPNEIQLTDFVTIPIVGVYGRASVHIDPIDAMMAAGDFAMPKPNDEITTSDDRNVRWRKATALGNGKLSTRSVRGGYAVTQFNSPAAGVMLLEATGHAAVYVNGQPYAGDPYAFGDFAQPVRIVKGENLLAFHVAQSELTARLVKPTSELILSASRAALPSLVRGQEGQELWASVMVTNLIEAPLHQMSVLAKINGEGEVAAPATRVEAASCRPCAFRIKVPAQLNTDLAELTIQVLESGRVLGEQKYELDVVNSTALQTLTFRSRVDDSVQSYVLVPASSTSSVNTGGERLEVSSSNDANTPVGAIVALHTDGMSARDFAALYEPKSWAHIIAPSGRSVYPLDWEEWSRIDATEALADAKQRLKIDPSRIYVTGHGMGAHGALVLATTMPDTFAALSTTAAWPSLWTYGGGMPDYRDPSRIQAMLLRAAKPSDTMAQLVNLSRTGVHLLHGADDRQVPVDQSRLIARELAKWHNDFAFQVKPDVGNWWDAETVDSPQVMQFLKARSLNKKPSRSVMLATSDLGTLSSKGWVTIAAQDEQFGLSRVELQRKDRPLSIVGTTKNVKRLMITKEAMPAKRPFVVRLDGTPSVTFAGMPASGHVWLERVGDRWVRRQSPDKSDKNPKRYGGIKAVFDHDVILVYGTDGSKIENAWSLAKAQFDAQTFAYRAGGALEVLPDSEFKSNQTRDRNVVLYGNVDTNSAWAALLSTSPVQVRKGRFRVGDRPEMGDDLGFVVVRPRVGSDERLVAAVGGTGIAGMRLTNRLRYFWAGVAYPDLILIGPEALSIGDGGIRAAGFFAENWDVEQADISWRDLAL